MRPFECQAASLLTPKGESRGTSRAQTSVGFRRTELRHANDSEYDQLGLLPPFARDVQHNDQAYFQLTKMSRPDQPLQRAAVKVPAAESGLWSIHPATETTRYKHTTSHRSFYQSHDTRSLCEPTLPVRTVVDLGKGPAPEWTDTSLGRCCGKRWQRRRYIHSRPEPGAPELTLSQWGVLYATHGV